MSLQLRVTRTRIPWAVIRLACALVVGSAVLGQCAGSGSMTNLDVVKQLHGSRPYSQNLLRSPALADSAEWWAAGSRDRLPWAGTWRGRDGIAQFFEALNRVMDYERFETEEYITEGGTVVAIIAAGGRAIATGRPFESHIVRVYTFEHGRIVRIRNYYDTAAYERALEAR